MCLRISDTLEPRCKSHSELTSFLQQNRFSSSLTSRGVCAIACMHVCMCACVHVCVREMSLLVGPLFLAGLLSLPPLSRSIYRRFPCLPF